MLIFKTYDFNKLILKIWAASYACWLPNVPNVPRQYTQLSCDSLYNIWNISHRKHHVTSKVSLQDGNEPNYNSSLEKGYFLTLCSFQHLNEQQPVFSDEPEVLKGSLFCCSRIPCKVIGWYFSQLTYSKRDSAWELYGSWESVWLGPQQSCLPFPRWIMDSNLCWHKARETKQQTLSENEGNMTFLLTKTLSSSFLTVPFCFFSKCSLVSIGPRVRDNRHSDNWRPFFNTNFGFLFMFLPDLTRKICYINPVIYSV